MQRIGAPAVATLAVATAVPAAGALGPDQQVPRAAMMAQRGWPPDAPGSVLLAASRSRTRPQPPAAADVADVRDGAAPAAERPPAAARNDPGSTDRPDEPDEPAVQDLQPRWLSADLNVWSGAGEDNRLLTVLAAGTKVLVTGLVRGPWAQVARDDRLVWVREQYLARQKVEPASAAGISGSPCPDGSSVESGLTANAVAVYRSVCAAFPAVSAWGGRSGYGAHGAGLALDIMVTGSQGTAIADYVRANAGALGVSEVIWAQRIWTVERAGDGWRSMSDRGSTTANHYDHVHVTVY